jgi:hypothetical protein
MQPAARFGPYEIIRRLGKSMNDVYLARDTRANRQAALKLIKSGGDAVSQLILEAERRGAAIQQRLRTLDPRVIEIYDFGDLDGYFYVAMQYVEGRNLAEVLKHDGRMSAYRAARIALEICGQLEKFHAFRPGTGAAPSVVHGDIKPSNIHLGPNETVRLLDFGIAKTLRPDRDSTFHNFGSPSYCSPERLGRSLLDQQADLWAVGVTLYEMVAGSPPYQAENTRKLERLIQSRRPPRALPATCPAPLKAVIGKALAPDAERRYQSAAAFGDDLKAFLEGEETAAGKEKRSAWKPNPTLESGQASQPKRTRRPPQFRRSPLRMAGRIAGALGCMLAGMVLFIGTSYCSRYWRASRQLHANLDYAHRPMADLNADWCLYTDMQTQFGFLGRYSPVERLQAPLRTAYAQAGAQALDDFDWDKAELCLTRAMDLGAGGPEIAGKLALARGYAAFEQGRRENARDRFLEAARDIPQSPDPHLGLARADLLASLAGDALAELAAAERLGYHLGPREREQRTAAYRLRGFEELQAGNVTAARQDFAAARIPDILAPARRKSGNRLWGGPPGRRVRRGRSSLATGRRGRRPQDWSPAPR